MTRLIILDRDGVINEDSEHYVRSPDEWRPIPGALEAIALLSKAGFRIVIATNQAGVAKNVFDMDTLVAIHEKLIKFVINSGGNIEHIYVCTHHPDENCSCRKPQPGMLIKACLDNGVNATNVPFVGDSLRDIQAALLGRCQPVLVLSGNGHLTKLHEDFPKNIAIYDDLMDFAKSYCR